MLCCAYLDLVPILAGEGILSLLLETLLALRKALVPVRLSDCAPSHICPPKGSSVITAHASAVHIVDQIVEATYFPTAMIAIS